MSTNVVRCQDCVSFKVRYFILGWVESSSISTLRYRSSCKKEAQQLCIIGGVKVGATVMVPQYEVFIINHLSSIHLRLLHCSI